MTFYLNVGFGVSFWMKVTSWSEAYNFIIGRREGFHVVRQQTSDTISMGGTGGGGVCMFVVMFVVVVFLLKYSNLSHCIVRH
jgi:hypothetical protein